MPMDSTQQSTSPDPNRWDQLWINVNLLTMVGGHYNEIRDAAIATQAGRIAWLGSKADLADLRQARSHQAAADSAKTVHDGQNCWVTPGLIDCHTHTIFADNRAREFEQRLQGQSYEDIARSGGGIISTVRATRQASKELLFESAVIRLQTMIAQGVTTVEIKSGYGLDRETELRMLDVTGDLESALPLAIQKTYLGAHTIPPEFISRRNEYSNLVCADLLPYIARNKLADAVDVFCDSIGMTLAESDQILAVATSLGLGTKVHADQLSSMGASALAAQYKCLSADHLEHCPESGVVAMAESGTVAVLLPGAYYYLRESKQPPINLFRKHQVPVAIATDLNPGSSPVNSLLTIMNMASTLYQLTPEEALAGVTIQAARALGLADDRGSLEPGKRADFVLWKIDSPAELSYWIGHNPCVQRVKNGHLD